MMFIVMWSIFSIIWIVRNSVMLLNYMLIGSDIVVEDIYVDWLWYCWWIHICWLIEMLLVNIYMLIELWMCWWLHICRVTVNYWWIHICIYVGDDVVILFVWTYALSRVICSCIHDWWWWWRIFISKCKTGCEILHTMCLLHRRWRPWGDLVPHASRRV